MFEVNSCDIEIALRACMICYEIVRKAWNDCKCFFIFGL